MHNKHRLAEEALHETLAFAWRNRDRATEHQREQILIAIVGFGSAPEKTVSAEVLRHMHAQRLSQFELDGILDHTPKSQPKKDGQ